MRVTVTGATGLVGARLVAAMARRGDEVTVLSRDAGRARAALGGEVEAIAWDPLSGPAPAAALSGRDGVVHLAGEPVAQRWNDAVKQRILRSRETGTRNLVAGLRAVDPRPGVLVSASAVGYYGPHGDERVDEETPAGEDFLARVCVTWEREALAARDAGVRVALVRTGVVLDPDGGALAKMLPPFKLGGGGPVAGGRQYMPWIAADDLVGLYLAALDGGPRWSGAFNGCAPEPVTNAEFSKTLGHVLHRPAIAPIPRIALKLLYGEMEQIVTTGARVVPRRPLALGHAFQHTRLEAALRDALSPAARR